jgi:hypothetical protein
VVASTIEPLQSPWQLGSVTVGTTAIGGGAVMMMATAVSQPLALSVIVTVYVPAHSPVAVALVPPPPGGGAQL